MTITKRNNVFTKIILVVMMVISMITPYLTQKVQASGSVYTAQGSARENFGIYNINGVQSQVARIQLNGVDSFCIQQTVYGVNYTYTRGKQVTDRNLIRAVNYGMMSDIKYGEAQGFIWGYLAGKDKEGIVADMTEFVQTYVRKLYNNPNYVYLGAEFTYDIITNPDKYPAWDKLDNGPVYYWNSSVGQNQISLATGKLTVYPEPRFDTLDSTKNATEKVEVKLTKTDVNSGQTLEGVKFDFYRDDEKIASDVVTDKDGVASAVFEKPHTATSDSFRFCTNYDKLDAGDKAAVDKDKNIYRYESLAQAAADKQAQERVDAMVNQNHVYKAVETETKTAYYLDPQNNSISSSIVGSGKVTLELQNRYQTGSISIKKTDEETKKPLSKVVFELYAKEDIIHPDGKTGIVFNKGQLVDIFPATNSNGSTSLSELYLGTYLIKEKTAKDAYVINPKEYEVVLTRAESSVEVITASKDITNLAQRGTISFVKKDKELNNGSQNGNIVDGNKDGAQGDATRVGATYGLFARDAIMHPDGISGVINYNQTKGSIHEITLLKGTDLQVKNVNATSGTLLATAKTDANGEISFGHLYLGNYFIREIEPSEGYLLDKTEYDVALTYAGQNVDITTSNTTVLEQVKKQAFDIYKGGHVPGTSQNAKPLEGVHFEVKLESDIQRLMKNGCSLEEAKKQAPLYDELVTDKKGQASSIELPYGTYRVYESVPALNYEKAKDFFVTVTEDSREHQSYTNNVIIDEVFTAYVKAVKLDKETGKTVLLPNTEFKIRALSDVYVDGKEFKAGEYIGYFTWNPLQGFWVDTWKTDETGTVMLNERISAGDFELVEVHAPNGYLVDKSPIKFSISNEGIMETAPDGYAIITAYKEDVSVKGQIKVEKHGEVLVDYKDGQFVYEERGLEGTHFEIVAKEDILDPSNDKTVIYKNGTVIEKMVTDKNGKAVSSKLPLGKYEVVEKISSHGFVLNGERQEAELKYKDETTQLVFDIVSVFNERQKVDVQIIKVDSEDKTVGLKGAEFDFITKEDILNADGNVIVKAGTILEHIISDENGMISITKDLPLDIDFELVETKSPIGYELDETPIEFNTNYQGQEVQTIIIEKTKENKRTKVDFSKTDITTGKELAGNQMMIFEKNNPGAVFTTWVSEDTPHTVEFLSTGVRYMLRETSAVYGFYLANDIEFELDQYGNAYIFDEDGNKVEAKDNLIKMENDLVKGKLVWNKTGEIFTYTDLGQTEFGQVHEPVWETSNLLQTEITIYAAEDITLGNGITYFKKDEAIQTLESDWDSVQSQELLVGKYYYLESKTGHGYIRDTEKHYFEIKDNQSSELQLIESTLWNNRLTIEIEFTKFMEIFKYHNSLDDAYKDVVFGIYAREDIYTYMGTVGIENGTLVGTTGIDELGQLDHLPDLPNGQYYLKELQTNPSYVLDEKEYDFEVSYHGQDISTYKIIIGEDGTIENELIRGSVEIRKHDSYDETNIMSGIEFNLSANSDMSEVVISAVTDDTGTARFVKLEIGKYYIQEAKQVDGFVLNETIYEVEVTTNGEVLVIDVMNKPTEMEFSKQDFVTGKELPGAEIIITGKDSKDIIDRWISTDTPHKIQYLVEGKEYVMTELSAPNGYEVAESITFVAKDGEKIVMKDKVKPKTPDTGDISNITLWLIVLMASCTGCIYLVLKRRNKQ